MIWNGSLEFQKMAMHVGTLTHSKEHAKRNMLKGRSMINYKYVIVNTYH